jgi:predicted PurR-regulated permease PerM
MEEENITYKIIFAFVIIILLFILFQKIKKDRKSIKRKVNRIKKKPIEKKIQLVEDDIKHYKKDLAK